MVSYIRIDLSIRAINIHRDKVSVYVLSTGVTRTGVAKCPWTSHNNQSSDIYPISGGIVPHYTGHLPGVSRVFIFDANFYVNSFSYKIQCKSMGMQLMAP